jgi:hypothetical protein
MRRGAGRMRRRGAVLAAAADGAGDGRAAKWVGAESERSAPEAAKIDAGSGSSVARQRTWLGAKGSRVQIPPPRPNLSFDPQRPVFGLKTLERHGLIALVGERPKGNCTERVLQATAASYVISPAARLVRDVGLIVEAARAGKRAATLAIDVPPPRPAVQLDPCI